MLRPAERERAERARAPVRELPTLLRVSPLRLVRDLDCAPPRAVELLLPPVRLALVLFRLPCLLLVRDGIFFSSSFGPSVMRWVFF